jgi:hypothetical protein
MTKKLGKLFYHILMSSIAVLMTGFLALGVRAFATAGTAMFIFFGSFVLLIVILCWYFVRRPPIEG